MDLAGLSLQLVISTGVTKTNIFIETIESYYAIAGNTLTQFSMEQIVDCDTVDEGCNGGLPTNAYKYVQGAGGIESYE